MRLKRGDRVFFFKDGTRSVTGTSITPFPVNRTSFRNSDRGLLFKEDTGTFARQAAMSFHLTPYELKHRDRAFLF